MRRPAPGGHSLERAFEDVCAALPPDIRVSVCTSRFPSHGLFGRAYDMVRASRHQGDVNHVTGDVHFLTYLLDRRRTVLTIHDCVMLGTLRGAGRWLFWLLWYWLPEKRSAAITVVSEATRQEVLRHLHCSPGKVRVIPNAVSEEFHPNPKPFNAARPRVLQVGTTANKNLERHAAALEGLDCEMTVLGTLTGEQSGCLRRHGIDFENVFGLSRAGVVEQYRRCDILLFASTDEGFGLPIVEANAVGRPVVTSRVSSMPEVAGDAACLVDPYNVASIRAGVRRVIEDCAYRERLVQRGFDNAGRFSVSAVAQQYAALYRAVTATADRT